jgi:hypothetical protein
MRRFALLAVVAAVLSVGAVMPSGAEAGCYRMGETGYHWYRNCWGPRWIYPAASSRLSARLLWYR